MKPEDVRKPELIQEHFSPEQIKFWREKKREKMPKPELKQLELIWPEVKMVSRAEYGQRLKKLML